MDLLVLKLIVLLSLFALTFVASLLPIKFIRSVMNSDESPQRRKYENWIGMMSCFAAGVFLSTCLLNLLPESQRHMKLAMDAYGISQSIPSAEIITSLGLFFILTIEQVVSLFADEPHYSAIPDDENSCLIHSHDNECHANDIMPNMTPHSHDHSPVSNGTEVYSKLRAVILLLALSLHSVFEGLAVGLQETVEQVLQIVIALLVHKIILAFSLGIKLVQSKLSLAYTFWSSFLFAIASPIGVVIGIVIVHDLESSHLINGIFQGVACGTFLYVTFFEILPNEFNHAKHRIAKVVLLILGYTLVAVVTVWHESIQDEVGRNSTHV